MEIELLRPNPCKNMDSHIKMTGDIDIYNVYRNRFSPTFELSKSATGSKLNKTNTNNRQQYQEQCRLYLKNLFMFCFTPYFLKN